MSLDQVFFVLFDKKYLRSGPKRKVKYNPLQASHLASKDGLIRGRAADGTPIFGRVGGKSKAQMIQEQVEAKKNKKRRRR